MSAFGGIAGIGAVAPDPVVTQIGGVTLQQPPAAVQGTGFGDILAAGMRRVEGRLETADALVRQFALDDSVPVHQVTFALEEARLSVELAMQVRARLVEGYRDLMNMQL